MSKQTNGSVIGRLLEELSWVGQGIKDYRNGGRGYENVLTAEALQGLDFLPRQAFLGAILAQANGAPSARERLIADVAEARFKLLPGDHDLIPGTRVLKERLRVQPDGVLESENVYALLEAKRIGKASFQPEQLAREYVLALREAQTRLPLLIVIVPTPPPVAVKGHGRMALGDAIRLKLPDVFARVAGLEVSLEDASARIDECVCWTSWDDIKRSVSTARASYANHEASVRRTIERLADSVIDAIEWHSLPPKPRQEASSPARPTRKA